jgi:hypothetical protein
MKKWLDRYENGGLVSKNSLNRKVTCSNCSWSWKLSDGGEDPLTCHKCGGTIKMENGGVIEDDMGQWAHPGKVTKINSNEITMQGVPYPVLGVDDTGYAQIMQPEMDYTFPGQYVTEYPMMQYGGLTKYKEKGEVKNTKTTPVVKKPVYQYTPQNFVQPSFNNIPYNVSYAEVPFINTDDIKGQIYANNQSKRGLEFHKKWMSSPMYKQMLYNSDPVNAKAIEKNRWDNYNKVKLTYDPVQPHDHPLWGASSNSTTGKIQFYPRGVEENVSNTGPHEISHSIDIDETGKNKKRNLPGKDMLKMYLYSNAVKTKQGTSNPLAEWKYKNNPSFYNYVAKPTETRARLSDIRQKAYENKLYDPFTQKVDANIFNKLLKFEFEKDKNWSPLYQLQNVYTNDQIIDLLNTVSKNDNNNLNTENANVDGMFAKNGGEMFNYKSGGQHGGLDRWFAEKWVDIKTGKPCGRQEGEDRNYPACRPSKRISSATPKTASELSSSEKERFKQEKTSSQRISYNHKRMEYGGENIDNMNYMKSGGNVPTNPELWSRAKSAARSKYDVYPSAYANGFAAKWYKSHGGGWRKAAYGMEVMGNGGVPNNPGFNALPQYVQQNIINNMATGGQKMPAELAYARFAAAGNLNQLGKYGYQDGGEGLPNDFNKFQEFNKTLPNNLRDDNFKYGDYSHYDLYGMWDASGKPNSFNDVKDTEQFRLQEDGTYHGFSVGNDGVWLKPKSHPSAFMEYMQGQLNPDPYFLHNHVIQKEDGRLQYVPNNYITKQSLEQKNEADIPKNINPRFMYSAPPSVFSKGGSVTLNAGGENHRIYVKTTNRGEGAKGHIMVNHPTMDKGMWDTIDLTKKAGAKTIAQGVAATKKWHRENPYKKQEGGPINLNLPVFKKPEINPLQFNKFLVNDRNQNLFIGGINPRYQNEDFSVGPYLVGVGNKYFQKFPVDYGVTGNYNLNDDFNINMSVGKNNINAGIKYKFNNGGSLIKYQDKGEVKKRKWYYPKEETTNERPYYDPPTETLYLNPNYNNEPEIVRQHELFHHLQKINGGAQRPEYYTGPLKEPNMMMNEDMQGAYWNRKTVDVNNLMDQVISKNPDFKFYPEDLFYNKVIDGLEYETPGTLENEARQYEDYIRSGGTPMFNNGGGIPERYRNMGFTSVGAKKQSTRPGKKWMVLAKKGDQYKVVHGGYKGMQDFKQHHSEQRKENFWNRMGGRNSSKATDPFSPLYWHKRFGTWEYGGQPMAVGGQNVMNPIVKKDNRNWLEYLKN